MCNEKFQRKCKDIVVKYFNAGVDKPGGKNITADDVFIVWSCKTLQNNKALVSTTVADGRYYEITYNGDEDETYVDVYKKLENFAMKGESYALIHKNECKVDGCSNAEEMTFGEAIGLMKKGYRVARKGWNGKNQYIELASNISYVNAANEVVNSEHTAIGNKAIAFVGTSGVQMGWLASQADMLAEDWNIVE